MLRKIVGGILLVAGTSIGAAVLALPVNTAHMGVWNAILVFIVCWIFMTLGAFYILEANLKVGAGTNIISIAKETIGTFGQSIAWVTYLCLLYALTSAYLIGGSHWIEAIAQNFNKNINFDMQLTIITALSAFIIYLGTRCVDYLNRILMFGLMGAYAFLSFTAIPHMDLNLLTHHHNIFDLSAIPLIITAFGFAIIVPSLTLYLNGDTNKLIKVILIGSIIPLLIYICWEFLILGLIPYDGASGLKAMHLRDKPVSELSITLETLLHHRGIVKAATCFSIFALITSLLGVTLSLYDFLADGLHIAKRGLRGIKLIALTFIPPFLIVKYFPIGFTYTLKFAGIFVAILLGLLPVWMVWQGRYCKKLKSNFEVPGGKFTLILTAIFFIYVIGLTLNANFRG